MLDQILERYRAADTLGIELDHAALAEVGMIVALTNKAEVLFEVIICALMPSAISATRCRTAQMGCRRERVAMLSLSQEVVRGGEPTSLALQLEHSLDEAEELVRRATRLEERRNTLVHSVYTINPVEGSLLRRKTTARGKGLNTTEEPIARGQLLDECKELEELCSDLSAFIHLVTRAQ